MQAKQWMAGGVAALCVSVSGSLLGLGISLGPFQLDLGGDGGYYYDVPVVERRIATFDDPICYAIEQRKLLEMVIEWAEQISEKESKRTIKKITIEPYLFGINENDQPVLRGNVVAEKILKEVTIKYGDNNTAQDDGYAGVFRPVAKDHNGKTAKNGSISTVSFDRVSEVRVVEQSNFKPPKDFNAIFKNGVARVICTVSSSE